MVHTFIADRRGSVTAEFAVGLPAVLLVLGLVIGTVQLSAERVALTALAGDLARLQARGDMGVAQARLDEHGGSPSVNRTVESGVLCVVVTSRQRTGLLSPLSVSGRGCAALSDGSASTGST